MRALPSATAPPCQQRRRLASVTVAVSRAKSGRCPGPPGSRQRVRARQRLAQDQARQQHGHDRVKAGQRGRDADRDQAGRHHERRVAGDVQDARGQHDRPCAAQPAEAPPSSASPRRAAVEATRLATSAHVSPLSAAKSSSRNHSPKPMPPRHPKRDGRRRTPARVAPLAAAMAIDGQARCRATVRLAHRGIAPARRWRAPGCRPTRHPESAATMPMLPSDRPR